jgi:transcriptional regulator
MGTHNADALRGTLDLLILRTLAAGSMHGWGICQRIGQMSEGALDVNQGSLYPALQRLEQKDWVTSEWQVTENNRQAKYYSLTREGKRAIAAETASWKRFASAVELIIETT